MKYFLIVAFLSFFQEGQLVVLPSKDPDVFRVIYKGDMKWNIDLTLVNEKGQKRFKHTLDDTDSFLLPIDLSKESTGSYTVKIATAAYDLEYDFEYVCFEDRVARSLNVRYDQERKVVTLEATEAVEETLHAYIYNESGDLLIDDEIDRVSNTFYRAYNLNGAPARNIQVIAEVRGVNIFNERFDF